MKYFKVFNTSQEYYNYIASDEFISPNVSTLRDSSNTWITTEVHKYEEDYLTFRALESGTFSLSANDVQYSLDNGETWVTLTAGSSTPTVNSGDTVLWKASNLTPVSGSGIGTFSSTGDFEVEGNLLSLVYGDDFENQVPSTSSNKYYFTNLFSGNTNIINAENLAIVGQSLPDEYCRQMFHSCSNLEKIPRVLSASTIGNSTYRAMFNMCSKITTAPSIYATTIGENSMAWMFEYCTSLTTPMEELSATTTYSSCYQGMFKDCTSLTTAPELLATTLAQNCYKEMFFNCTSLTTAPELPATTLANYCYQSMFYGCTSLTTAPELPSTTLAQNCYQYMFSGCTSLTTAPSVLPAATVTNVAYYEMFNQCTSLMTAPSISATSFGSQSCRGMFYGCTSLTTTQATLSATTLGAQCCRGMYMNCTSLTTAPELLATTLADGCYYDMFNGCSALTTAQSVLPATTLEINCYRQMFHSCKSLVTAPTLSAETVAASACTDMFNGCSALTTVQSELSATTMADYCYKGMFYRCSSLTVAPSLPATTLATHCYNQMFELCASLITAPNVLPATTLTEYCYTEMFGSCSSLTTAPELPATTLTNNCYKQMFKDCNKLNYIKCLATDISATDCTKEWVYHVQNNNGTFVKHASMSDWTRDANGIPTNWTVQDYSDVHVTGVTISSTAVTITKGESATLTATVSPNDAYDKVITWSTSDSTVATVNDGVVTAVGCGNAIITVTTHDGGYTAQCTTTVENPVTGVTLDTNVIYIITGDTSQLVATVSPSDACGDKSVTWSSDDTSIATVSNNGLVTAVSTGSAVVTVTTTVGSYTASCAVEVSEPVAVTGVTLNKATLDIFETQTEQLVATVLPNNAADKSVTWTSSNSNIATVDSNGIVSGVASGSAIITVTTHDGGYTASCEVTVSEQSYTSIVIEGASSVSAESCQYVAICDNVEDVTSSATWSITEGSQYATINSSNGNVTILNGANESSVTIQVVYGNLTGTSTVTLTYVSGATSETETEITTDVGGNTTTVTTTVTEFEDGSSVEVSETVVTDDEGNIVGSSESNITTNADGSYNGNTTNYNANGDPTDGINVTGDTDGNVSTQSVEYDESGNTVVTGYDIDTSESESGKIFNHDGVNTDYYAFDVTHGFVLDFEFTMDFDNQPSGQENNQHNILTAKRATPEPWYGFQLRQISNQKYIQLGTQFSTGVNTNTQLNPSSITGNVGTYNLRIIYDPTSTGNTFTCIDTSSQTVLYVSDGVFPDIEELKYLKIVIGYAVNASGNPMRYSNITVQKFELKKLKNVANPTITYENGTVVISCSTVGANVYYRLNLSGSYSAYTTPITITADTVVQAYATYSGDTSDIIREDFKIVNVTGVTLSDNSISIVQGRTYTLTATVLPNDALDKSVTWASNNTNVATVDSNGVVSGVASGDATITVTTVDGGFTAQCSVSVSESHDYSKDYFTIESLDDNNTITFHRTRNTGIIVSASTDNGETWSVVLPSGITGTITAGTLNNGEKLLLKQSNANRLGHQTDYNGLTIDANKNYIVYGNINSLLNGDNFTTYRSDLGGNTFRNLFSRGGNGSATLISAENLVLLDSLGNNPTYEYRQMFLNCSNLTKAPTITNTSLNASTCEEMYKGCSSLIEIKILSTNISASNCLKNWVNGVGSNGTFYKKQSTTFPSGDSGIPSGWSTQDID